MVQKVKRKRTLYLKSVTYQQLWYMWNVKPDVRWEYKEIFIQCNKSGQVNWDKNSAYTLEELKEKLYKVIC